VNKMYNLISECQKQFDTIKGIHKPSARVGSDLCPYKYSLENNGSTAKDLSEKQRNACKVCDGKRGACKYFM